MSLASDFAAAITAESVNMSAVEATAPTGYTGPGGILVATVTRDGNCDLTAANTTYHVPAAIVLGFAAWVTNTFGD